METRKKIIFKVIANFNNWSKINKMQKALLLMTGP